MRLFKLPVIYRKIHKLQFEKFCIENYGEGIKINPYIMAFPFVCMDIDNYLQKKKDYGLLIFDELSEHIDNVEKSVRTLRLDPESVLKTTHIIEKGFFIDSAKSYPIQLADLVAYYIRKYEESKAGLIVSPYDKECFERIEKIISEEGNSNYHDILDWVKKFWAK